MPDHRNQFETKSDERKLREWRESGANKLVGDAQIWGVILIWAVIVAIGCVLVPLMVRGC